MQALRIAKCGRVQALALLCLVGATASAAPKPSPAPKSWNLTFYYEDPQRITVTLPGEQAPRTYWYLLYTVVNETGRDLDFYPDFHLMTATGRLIPSELGVNPAVFEQIKKRYARSRPFLQSRTQIIGRLRQTADHAEEGVAIWPDTVATTGKFTIYISGLSGESAEVPNPAFDPGRPQVVQEKLADGTTIPRAVNPRAFTLHRTLAIHYDLPGDARTRSAARPVRTGQEWVMR